MTDPKHEQTPRRYQAPRFTQGRFAVENADDGFPVGVFSGGHEILPYADDGSVHCHPPGDRMVIQRVIAQEGDVIRVLDRGGDEFRYRFVPLEAAARRGTG